MSLKPFVCKALSFLKLHRPDCQRCVDQDCYGIIRQRLTELNEHAKQGSGPRPDENNDAA